MERKARQSNIELLRILAMIGVVVLHYNARVFKYTEARPENILSAHILEAIFITAVDIFMIIFGFFQYEKEKVTLRKPISLLAQVSVYKIADYILCSALTHTQVSAVGVLQWLVPANYFVNTYVAVFLFSPYINRLLKSLNNSSLKKLMIIYASLFVLLPCFIDVMVLHTGSTAYQAMSIVSNKGAWDGYTFTNYLFMYLIGAAIRRWIKEGKTIRKKHALYLFLIGIGSELAVVILKWCSLIRFNMTFAYNSPFVIMSAAGTFLFFYSLKIKTNRFINTMAQATFTVYFVHAIMLRYIPIEKFSLWSLPMFMASLIATVLIIYLSSFLIFLVYRFFAGRVAAWFGKTKLANVVID